MREVLKVVLNKPLTRFRGNTAKVFVPIPIRCTIWLVLVDVPMTYDVAWTMILAPLGLIFNTMDLYRCGHASLDTAVVVSWNVHQSCGVLSSAIRCARVGLWVGPKHIQSQAFFVFVPLPLLDITIVLFYLPYPFLAEMDSFIIFKTPTLFNINALESFFLVLATLDIPFVANAVSNVCIQGVVARAKGEY